EGETPVFEIHHIVLHTLLHQTGFSDFASITIDLDVTCDPGRNKMSDLIPFDFLGVLFQLADHVGSGTNDGHIAQEHVYELRQFVQVGLSQKPSNADNAWIILGDLMLRIIIDRHGPELITFEKLVLLSRPQLLEYDRTL